MQNVFLADYVLRQERSYCMTGNVLLLILAFILTILYRLFVSLNIRYAAMSKAEYKDYQRNHSVIERWFFIQASNCCKDKYSRGEHKKIHHKNHVFLYSLFTILLHIFFLFLTIVFILCVKEVISQSLWNGACAAYYIFFLLSIIPLYFIEGIRNREYHKNRHK